MWRGQRDLLPGATHAPTLYGLGDSVAGWAAAVLGQVPGGSLIVVGNSIGGSCALEMAALAPDRIAALVLVGAKAAHRPDPALRATALSVLSARGVDAAWERFWAPLFGRSAAPQLLADAKRIAAGQPLHDLARSVSAFHARPGREALLPALRCPVICVSGDQDTAPGPAVTAAQARAARHGRCVIVPDCGHYVPMERPEALNAILQALMDQVR